MVVTSLRLLDHWHTPLRHSRRRVNGVDLHVAVGGTGPPVYLVHGSPKTMYGWRHLVPHLTPHYTVVLLDLRGFGDSERPTLGYDTKTLADDVVAVADDLGHPRFRLMGEDWGAAVAYAVASFHRHRVDQLVFQEMRLPGLAPDPDPTEISADDTRTGWHFTFFGLPGYPELLMTGRERAFWTQFVHRQLFDPEALSDADLDHLISSAARPGGLHAVLALYRSHDLDAEQNREQLRTKLLIPVLAVGGAAYLGDEVRRHMVQAADDVRGVVVHGCGHHPALEAPEQLAGHLLEFFAQV